MKFSESEHELLRVLGRKKMTIKELTDAFYASAHHPFNDTIFVASMIRRINRKCEYLGKTWSLVGKGSGRGGRTVWREVRKRANGANHSRRHHSKKDRYDTRMGAR